MGAVRLPVFGLAFSGLPQFFRVIWAIPLWALANSFLLFLLDALLLVVRKSHTDLPAYAGTGRIVDSLTHGFDLATWSAPDSFDHLAELWTLGVLIFPLALLYFSLLSAAVARAALRPGDFLTAYLGVGRDENRIALIFVEYLAFGAVLGLAATTLLVPLFAIYHTMIGHVARAVFGSVELAVWYLVFLISWSFFSLAIPISLDHGTYRGVTRSFVMTRGRRVRLFFIYVIGFLAGLVIALAIGAGLGTALGSVVPPGSASLRLPPEVLAIPSAKFLISVPFTLLIVANPPTLTELVEIHNLTGLFVQSLMIAVLTLFTMTPMVRVYQRLHEAGIGHDEPAGLGL